MSNATANQPATSPAIEAIDPWKQPFEFLRSKGWTFKGNPHLPTSLFYDPTKPKVDSEVKEAMEIPGVELDPNDQERKKMRPCIVRTIQRTVIRPAAPPVAREEAVQIQLLRDYEADETKAKNKK